ncbi:MAG: aminopeptidase N [Pseudomonadota bacterium]
MRTDVPQTVRLDDYEPYPFEIDQVLLHFDLDPDATIVTTKMKVRRKDGHEGATFELDGEELSLKAISVNGEGLSAADYSTGEHSLTLTSLPDTFELETVVEIAPIKNTTLSGLYISGGRFCTQCEATGFRRITYWPDRPDVMSRYTVEITANKDAHPILLSNGSPMGHSDLGDGRHRARWEDPHRKPSYLFALCAGDYDIYKDSFTTMNGREVELAIHVDKGEADKAAWAMDSLKRSMKWDEDTFGREYDLDVFNIVAVRDFNFGAMENKGLNIFNSAYVLADEASATDADFEAIESIVAHEYFHNWTGNRITCRDWFQLCLKEGLTVFRDQEFSADMRSRPVQRIKDVIRLRARQFAEDAGPLAHPVRPDSYGSIDNLYTATVYEKGAELIRMLKRLIGDDAFAKGLDIYFERHDGDAATIEDFYACFEEASGEDLTDFRQWYSQPGTPTVTLEETWDEDASEITLTVSQETRAIEGQNDPRPVPLPLAASLISADGETVQDLPITLDTASETFGVTLPAESARPLVSFARGFSAPIRVDRDLTQDDQLKLAAAETDPFNRWDLFQALLKESLLNTAYKGAGPDAGLLQSVGDASRQVADSDSAYAALLLRLPDVGELFLEQTPADPVALADARKAHKIELAKLMAQDILDRLAQSAPTPFKPDAEQAGIRSLRAALMDLAAHCEDTKSVLPDLFAGATSMTEQQNALSALITAKTATSALETFYEQWKTSPLVVDKWFALQARATDAVGAMELAEHADFDLGNPNRVRALAAHFAIGNLAGFHDPSGEGHAFLSDIVRKTDTRNPALAARLLTSFEQWRSLEPKARQSAESTLNSLKETGLSRNSADIVLRALS